MTDHSAPIEQRLEPCPFCGGEAQRITLGPDDGPDNAGGDIISCTRCYASSHVEFGRKENLVDHWNTRANRTATADIAALVEEMQGRSELPSAFQFVGDKIEDLFDPGLRHKSGKKPYDYLVQWLSMLRPFAYATRDDSWGEMEKLLCIVLRNYVENKRLLAKAANALTSQSATIAEQAKRIEALECLTTAEDIARIINPDAFREGDVGGLRLHARRRALTLGGRILDKIRARTTLGDTEQ
jgi:Lar family restriction alleviation protein